MVSPSLTFSEIAGRGLARYVICKCGQAVRLADERLSQLEDSTN